MIRKPECIHLPLFVSASQSLSVCLLSFLLVSAPFPLLGSQLTLFLWPFDLGERVWSFKVLLFPLSGAPLFLPSGLGFQSDGSLVLWLGGSGGWGLGGGGEGGEEGREVFL